MTTRSCPAGTSPELWRNASRTRRFMRFRTTALPTRRDAVTPSRLGRGVPGCGAARSTKCSVATRAPRAAMSWYSGRFLTRRSGPSRTVRLQFRPAPIGARLRLLLVRGHGEADATLAATVGEHLLAARRGVSGHEAVGVEPVRVAGLESALGRHRTCSGRGASGGVLRGGRESAMPCAPRQAFGAVPGPKPSLAPKRAARTGPLTQGPWPCRGGGSVVRAAAHARKHPPRFLGRDRLYLLHDEEQASAAGQARAEEVRSRQAGARHLQRDEDAAPLQVRGA